MSANVAVQPPVVVVVVVTHALVLLAAPTDQPVRCCPAPSYDSNMSAGKERSLFFTFTFSPYFLCFVLVVGRICGVRQDKDARGEQEDYEQKDYEQKRQGKTQMHRYHRAPCLFSSFVVKEARPDESEKNGAMLAGVASSAASCPLLSLSPATPSSQPPAIARENGA